MQERGRAVLVNSTALGVEGEEDCEPRTANAQDPPQHVRMRARSRVATGGLHQYLSTLYFAAWSLTELGAC